MPMETRVVSEHGFMCFIAKPCPACGHKAQMVVIAGNDKGKYGAFQVECPNCQKKSHKAEFFRFDEHGELLRVDPYAREAAEAYWNVMAEN